MSYTIEQLKSMGAKPVTTGYSPEQLKKLGAKPVEAPPEPSALEKVSRFVGDVAKSIVEPVATLAVRPYQLGKAITGATEEEQAVNLPFIGKIETAKTGEDVYKDVGRGAQTVALGVGGAIPRVGAGILGKTAAGRALQIGASKIAATPGIVPLAKGVTKTPLLQSVKQFAGVGAKGGALVGGGAALEQGKGLGEVATDTAIGGAFGGVTGGALPILGRGISKAYGEVTKPISARISNAIDDLEDNYLNIARGWIQTQKASEKATRITAIKNKSGTIGRTPERVLAEKGIIPEYEGSTFTTSNQAQKLRDQTARLKQLNKTAIREAQISTEPISIDEIERSAIARARSQRNIAAGIADNLEMGIRRQMNGYRRNYGNTVTLDILDDIKTAKWGQTKFSLTKEDRLASDVDYIIAKTAQETIEETAAKAGAVDVAQLNREIGDVLEAAKFLDSINGKKVLYGRMGTHLLKISGAIIGTGGGPLGSLAGWAGGDVVARILRSVSISSPIKRMLLRDLQQTDPAAYIKTINWLKQQGLDRESRLLLPGPTPLGSARNPIITPPPTTYEKPATHNVGTRHIQSPRENSIPIRYTPKINPPR